MSKELKDPPMNMIVLNNDEYNCLVSIKESLKDISVQQKILNSRLESQYAMVDDGGGWYQANLADCIHSVSDALNNIAKSLDKKGENE